MIASKIEIQNPTDRRGFNGAHHVTIVQNYRFGRGCQRRVKIDPYVTGEF